MTLGAKIVGRIQRLQDRVADQPGRFSWLADTAARAGRFVDRHATRIVGVGVVILAIFSSLAFCQAQRAAELAQATLETTRQSFAAAQRAGVYFQGLQFIAVQGDAPLRWHIGPVWENSGATPTKELTFELSCPRLAGRTRNRVDPYDLRSSFAPLFLSSLLGPKQSQIGGVCEVTPEELERVKSGSLALYVVAIAHYKDTLDETAAHETRQCMRIANLSGDFESTEGAAPSYAALPCPARPNCADEACKARVK